MTTSVERELGELNAKVERLEDEMREIRRDVRIVRDALVSVTGGWRLLLVFGTLTGMAGAALARIMPLFGASGQ
jgi:hypothetical protein